MHFIRKFSRASLSPRVDLGPSLSSWRLKNFNTSVIEVVVLQAYFVAILTILHETLTVFGLYPTFSLWSGKRQTILLVQGRPPENPANKV